MSEVGAGKRAVPRWEGASYVLAAELNESIAEWSAVWLTCWR